MVKAHQKTKQVAIKVLIAFFLLILVIFPRKSIYAGMNSANYTIWEDSVDSGGGQGSSALFGATDAIGESAQGNGQNSANFNLTAGLPSIFAEPIIQFSLSSSVATFSPNISPVVVSSASYTFTVRTNAPFGYAVQVLEDGNFRNGVSSIPQVADGVVSAGFAEYGVNASGVDKDSYFSGATDAPLSVVTPTVLADRTTFTSESVTTITHHAAVSSGFPTGAYAHQVTYVAIARF